MNRRSFVVAGALGTGAVLGANDQIRVGTIGAGGRGRLLAGEFREIGAQVNAVYDVYEANLQACLKVANTGAKPYDNYKRLLDDRDIATVNAGKDVSVEKPRMHRVEESFRMIEAVRRKRRVLQLARSAAATAFIRKARKFSTAPTSDRCVC
jgi:predicted dehydrogenase